MTNGQPPKNCRNGRASRERQDKEYSKIRDGKDAARAGVALRESWLLITSTLNFAADFRLSRIGWHLWRADASRSISVAS